MADRTLSPRSTVESQCHPTRVLSQRLPHHSKPGSQETEVHSTPVLFSIEVNRSVLSGYYAVIDISLDSYIRIIYPCAEGHTSRCHNSKMPFPPCHNCRIVPKGSPSIFTPGQSDILKEMVGATVDFRIHMLSPDRPRFKVFTSLSYDLDV